jgi:uncharacterized protein YkwD
MIKKVVMVFGLLLLLTGGIFAISQSKQDVESLPKQTTSTPPINSMDLINLVNKERQEAGLKPLVVNDKLVQSAQAKCQDMITKNYWAHNSPDGREPWVFFDQSGYEYRKAEENLAFGQETNEAIVSGWMLSPTHKKNILDDEVTDTGTGVCSSNNYQNLGHASTLVVQHFASAR